MTTPSQSKGYNPLNYSLGELRKAVAAGGGGAVVALGTQLPQVTGGSPNWLQFAGVLIGGFIIPFLGAFGFNNDNSAQPNTPVPAPVQPTVLPQVIPVVPPENIVSPFPPSGSPQS